MYTETKWTRAYQKASHHEAWSLEQSWDGRQYWYPTPNYVAWLERKMSLQKAKVKSKEADDKRQISDCMVRLCGHIHELSNDQIADNIMEWSRQLKGR